MGQKKIKKVKKKSAGEKSKQAVVEVASELLFGLVLKCPRNICDWALVWPRSKSPEMAWNGTDFFLIVFKIFNRVVFPYDFWKKIISFRILLGTSWYVFKLLFSDFQWTGEILDHI